MHNYTIFLFITRTLMGFFSKKPLGSGPNALNVHIEMFRACTSKSNRGLGGMNQREGRADFFTQCGKLCWLTFSACIHSEWNTTLSVGRHQKEDIEKLDR